MNDNKSPVITVEKFGHEYTLVLADNRYGNFPAPCCMGFEGYALKSCKKLKKGVKKDG